jgi:glycosyltransferase involved in cell wall biosynthesis
LLRSRVLIVSHPCVVPANQAVYRSLGGLGWDVTLVVPNRWRHEYTEGTIAPRRLDGFDGRLVPMPVVFPGRPGRHFYRGRLQKLVRDIEPVAAFVEAETYALAGLQWSLALSRSCIPFGIQADENLDRPLPWWVKQARAHVLRTASFVAARSPSAAQMIRRWGATLPTPLIPHAVPLWPSPSRPPRTPIFTVGFAGRLTPEKGVDTLLAAARRLQPPVRLLLVGDGALRNTLARETLPGGSIEIRPHVSHNEMPNAYAEMDVLVLPSRTRPTWADQFGRVLVESLWCGVPVIGSSSGEIPWVVETTRGGLIFQEGDEAELAARLQELRDDPKRRHALAEAGRQSVAAHFAEDAVARALGDALRALMPPRHPIPS